VFAQVVRPECFERRKFLVDQGVTFHTIAGGRAILGPAPLRRNEHGSSSFNSLTLRNPARTMIGRALHGHNQAATFGIRRLADV
jgi:hypothetical protein